ncbi:Aminopeptidase Y-like protein [Emericellopsis cladophorae]|uniref:Peptide hydrolase n=1 Tax=Emericellopsis cladophorae TaxID=2686198 RepID=A0A9P9Y9I7_9HYPO|nr:Aminopeptidase Y-like protein [Emericellopsis cladophorae]KAI6785279.1 Aminopeptidase Y-like protein [Emericellopsis cladophorae]
MARLSVVAALAFTGAASALQIPLQIPINTPWTETPAVHQDDGDELPLIDSKTLQDRIASSSLEARAKVLYDLAKRSEDEYNHPTRVIGSKGHEATLTYIQSTLAQLGSYYNVSSQSFPAVTGNVFESRLVVGAEVPSSAAPMGLTPPTRNNEPVHGQVILAENEGCEPSDVPEQASGNIVLIKRGTCPFGTKSENAGKAGALAAIVYNTDPEPVQGTLGTPSPDHVATFGIGGTEGSKYVEKIRKGEKLDAIAYIDAEVRTIVTTNIIAQTLGGDAENCVMAGGHSDSVAEGPGINDDGTGSLSLLEVAVQLSRFRVNNCVRLAWWAAEEEGLLGSDYYVSQLSGEDNQRIRLFMDYDMMASPNYAYQIYNATNEENPTGSAELKELYIDWYEDQGLNYTFIPFDGRSDYDGFIRNGIPGGGIATGAEGVKTKDEEAMFGGKAGDWYDPNYHQIGDDLRNLALDAWEVNTKLIAHSIATFAKSFKGFPERNADAEISSYGRDVKYHGSKLVV